MRRGGREEVAMLIPDELRLETYERRPNVAVFDRLDLVVAFRAGRNGKGAIVRTFLDGIKAHDKIVGKIELFMNDVEELKRNYRKRNRLFRNLDSAWNLIMDNPVDYHDYLRLLPQMDNIEERMEVAIDPIIKVELSAMYARFKELEPLCSRQLLIYNAYAKSRGERDEAVRLLVAAEKELLVLKDEEKALAAQISDDHVMADEAARPLSVMFPNVQVGFVLAKINGDHVEDLPFEEVLARVRRARSPHNTIFLRYDYRYDPFSGNWRSLQDLREMGVCVEDPLLQRAHFISLATQGDAQSVQQLILSGEDPNAVDFTGNTALVAAATNSRAEVVKLLFRAGADINLTDKNMMTPLLYCANRGQLEMVKLLLELGADRAHTDRNLRGPLFYAVLSGVLPVVQVFFNVERKDITERLWGFTVLHLAANQGFMTIVEYLLSQGCSIYKTDKKGRTPEDVARECGHNAVLQRLIDERFGAPGQFILALPGGQSQSSSQLWVGDVGAMEVAWCADVDITAVIYLRPSESAFPGHCAWLRKDSRKTTSKAASRNLVSFASFVVKEQNGVDCWSPLAVHLDGILAFVRSVTQVESVQKIVVCDETCRAAAPAVAIVLMLLLGQIRVKQSIELLHRVRPGIELGKDILRGLDELQVCLDNKLLRRINARTKDSVVASIAF